MGTLALMGSGELTATMVEVHKMLLSRLSARPSALFLDTPAGFQLNAEKIGANAVEYFRKRVGYRLDIASYKSSKNIAELDAALAYQKLREADYILMGPGSPTYTVDQLQSSQIPQIFIDHIRKGGCLVTASAAALTAGKYTLPVYEIYKVGQPLHWIAGLDILGAFGLHLLVIPHWNNAEGGTHDTSCCFMGTSRFNKLASMLAEPLPVLGLDEHTACIIDFTQDSFEIFGIGSVVLHHHGNSQYFVPGTTYSLQLLKEKELMSTEATKVQVRPSRSKPLHSEESDFWSMVHNLTETFQKTMTADDLRLATSALLDLDSLVWQAEGNKENPEFIAQARDLFREQMAELGTRAVLARSAWARIVEPLVDSILSSRQLLREKESFEAGDALREALTRAGITVEDTEDGYRWHHSQSKEEDNDHSS